MATVEELNILIEAKTAQAINDLKKVDTQTGKTEKSAKKMAASMLKTGLAAGAAALSVGKLVQIGKESVQLYGVQIQAEQKLAAAIRATGDNVDVLLPQYKEFASAIQAVTTVGDETTLGLIQQAKSLGVNNAQIEEATKGAIGLSKALGIGTQQALRGVANALNGEFTTLQRYIPALRTTEDESEKLAILQRAMADGFEVAKAEAESGFGAMEQYKNTLGDLKEELGLAITEGTKPFTVALTDLITKYTANIQKTREFRIALEKLRSGEDAIDDMGLDDIATAIEAAKDEMRGLGDFQVKRYQELQNYITALEAERAAKAELAKWEAIQTAELSKQQAAAKLAAEAQAAAAEAQRKDLETLQEAYASTDEGQRAALESQIAFFEGFKQGPMAVAVLEDLREQLAGLAEDTDTTSAAVERYNNLIAWQRDISAATYEAEQEHLDELKGHYDELANRFSGAFSTVITTLKETGDIGEAMWQGLKEAAKESIAMVLEGLAKEAIARAALAAASLRFAQAAAYTGAAAAALGAASAVRSFREGGVVNEPVVGTGQNTGQTYTFAENGPEEVSPTARSGGGEMIQNNIYIDRKKIFEVITKGSRTGGGLSIYKEALV